MKFLTVANGFSLPSEEDVRRFELKEGITLPEGLRQFYLLQNPSRPEENIF
jgi:hypothetical protein